MPLDGDAGVGAVMAEKAPTDRKRIN